MDNDDQYEALLRSFFDSCDLGGTGLLSSVEFKDLCHELNLEPNDYNILHGKLFYDRSTINYQHFKTGLLQLLSGSLEADDRKISLKAAAGPPQDEKIRWDTQADDNKKTYDSETAEDFVNSFRLSDVTSRQSRYSSSRGSTLVNGKEVGRKSKVKKYGRKTKPENQVDKKSDNRHRESVKLMENQDNIRTEKRQKKQQNIKPIQEEEFVTQADGKDWVIPAYETGNHNKPASGECLNPREALSTIWKQVIGDLQEPINVEQLQELYQALSLNSSKSELYQLFDMLDEDEDGLICFTDFTSQIPIYSTPDDVTPPKDDVTVAGGGGLFADELFGGSKSNGSAKTENQKKSPSRKSVNQNGGGGAPRISMMDEVLSPQSYTGPPRQQQRRRRQQLQHKRQQMSSPTVYGGRNARGVILPHYHPIYRRNLIELPLYYLTDEDNRHVSVERLLTIWNDEGIEDCDAILEKLGIKPDESFSIEVFSESIEQELNDNKLHQAVCALYKNGIKFYRSQLGNEDYEKDDLRDEVKDLKDQIRNMEEKLENSEQNFHEKISQMEHEKQSEISRLHEKFELENERNARKVMENEINELKEKVPKHEELERKLKKKLEYFEHECERLKKEAKKKDETIRENEKIFKQHEQDIHLLAITFQQSKRESSAQQRRLEEMLHEMRKDSEKTESRNIEIEKMLMNITSRVSYKKHDVTSSTDTPSRHSMFHARRKSMSSTPKLPSFLLDDVAMTAAIDESAILVESSK